MTHISFNNCEEQLALAEFSFECTAIPAFWIDQSGLIFRVNQAACEYLGYSRDELQSLHVFEVDPSASPETWPNHWRKLKAQKRMSFTSRHLTKTGQIRPVEITVNFIKIGQEEFNFAFAKDLTAQREAETALRETQERYALVIKAANDGIWDWDLRTRQVYFSDRWYAMLGLEEQPSFQVIDQWLTRVHPEDLDEVNSNLSDYGEGRIDKLKLEFRIRHQQGHYLWVLCQGMALYDFNDELCRIAGSMTDITERRQAQDQLLHDALHDPLTGLPNRNLLLEHLNELILNRQLIQDSEFAVLFLDIDRFKLVNDSLGHRAGDQLLIEVAQRLRKCISAQHTVARLGGDEFIVVLRNIGQAGEVKKIAQHILKALAHPVHLQTQTFYPKVSIGITLSNATLIHSRWNEPQDTLLAEDYIQQADIAMYRAKTSNQAQYAIFTHDMQATVVQRLQLEVDLQSALERNELKLVYQPIVDLQKGNLIGLEALLRWHHPQRGLIGPDVFIPIAEETGMILALGNWGLREACRQMSQWQTLPNCHPDLFVAVNLASHQLMQPDFLDQVHETLRNTGVNPRNIKLEITERTVIENKDFARAQLLALRNSQIRICMDDFGTGYSSLGYLHQLPIDCLKIDQSFVQQIQTRQDKPEIIRAILAIAHSLGMNVIAEGIETLQQATLLQDIGCPCGQGYLFDRPLSALSATKRLRASQPMSAKASATKAEEILAS